MKHRVVAGSLAAMGASTLLFVVAPAAPTQDLNCADFQFQEDAQAVFNQDPTDPNHLDADKDGVACEELPHRGTSAPPESAPPESAPPESAPSAPAPAPVRSRSTFTG